MYAILSVAFGGAFGAVTRYGVNIGMARLLGTDFPWGTITVNILGSFIMGIIISVFAHFWQPPESLKIFIVTGFLGAFTTFSTFSLDFSSLCEGGRFDTALIYAVASVLISIGALFAGLYSVRMLAI